jgi:hypothetical protein
MECDSRRVVGPRGDGICRPVRDFFSALALSLDPTYKSWVFVGRVERQRQTNSEQSGVFHNSFHREARRQHSLLAAFAFFLLQPLDDGHAILGQWRGFRSA